LLLTPGTTNELKFEVKRLRGFTNELKPIFQDLPDGVSVLATNVPQKEGTVSLRLTAATNAPNFQGPIPFSLLDSVTKAERPVPFELTTRGETGFNQLLVESTDHFWLTVRSKPVETNSVPKKK
jgi:hypothetical protein